MLCSLQSEWLSSIHHGDACEGNSTTDSRHTSGAGGTGEKKTRTRRMLVISISTDSVFVTPAGFRELKLPGLWRAGR